MKRAWLAVAMIVGALLYTIVIVIGINRAADRCHNRGGHWRCVGVKPMICSCWSR